MSDTPHDSGSSADSGASTAHDGPVANDDVPAPAGPVTGDNSHGDDVPGHDMSGTDDPAPKNQATDTDGPDESLDLDGIARSFDEIEASLRRLDDGTYFAADANGSGNGPQG